MPPVKAEVVEIVVMVQIGIIVTQIIKSCLNKIVVCGHRKLLPYIEKACKISYNVH